MKVLLVIDNLGSGGAQRQMVNLAIGLNKRGHEVELFYYFPQNFFEYQLEEAGIKMIKVSKTGKAGLNVLSALRKTLRKGNYDVAVAYLKAPNIYLSIAAKLAGVKTKIITSERTRTNLSVLSPVLRLRYFAHLLGHHVVFNSYHEKDNWTRRFSRLGSKSMTIYNGIDTARFKPLPYTPELTPAILGIGSISPDKNILCLIRAVGLLKSKGFKVNVVWYGKEIPTVARHAEYAKEVYAEIEKLDIADCWQWKQPISNIESVFNKFDFLVLSSLVEGLPNVVCEALSSGLPVIISNSLDHPRLVADGERGFLFTPDDAEDLADRIQSFYHLDKQKVEDLRRNARSFALSTLDISLFVDSYERLFKNLVKA